MKLKIDPMGWWLGCVVVVVGCGAPAPVKPPLTGSVGEPATPPAPGDANSELAWAKTRFANELGSFDMTPHSPELLAWLRPKGHMPVFVSSTAGRCQPGVLSRGEADDMTLVVYTKERIAGGDVIREYIEGDVGEEFDLGGSGGSEKRQNDGTWMPYERWSQSESGSWGHLSQVTNAYARFAGTWVDVAASCKGEVTTHACTDGTIECSTCTGASVEVTRRPMGMMQSHTIRPPLIGCPTCPATSNAELDRVQALLPLDGWTVENERSAPTIYRRKVDCN